MSSNKNFRTQNFERIIFGCIVVYTTEILTKYKLSHKIIVITGENCNTNCFTIFLFELHAADALYGDNKWLKTDGGHLLYGENIL